MEKMEKKKVLFLGGSNKIVEMVKTAKELGIYSIVADPVLEAPAKKYAAASYDINPADIKGLMEINKSENIDGIYAMLGDVTTWNALALCKRLSLPFYLPKDQIEYWGVQDKFKDFCKTFDVSIIDEVMLADNAEKADKTIVEFPLVLSKDINRQEIYAIV